MLTNKRLMKMVYYRLMEHIIYDKPRKYLCKILL